MSSLFVPVTTIERLEPHPDAERLALAQVLGWQVVVPKDQHQPGERVVYFPIDTVLPLALSERLGITRYLNKQRIRCARLRGQPSFGLVIAPDQDWPLGENVADYYGVTKYEPPPRANTVDALPDDPLFVRYTTIEDMRNFPTVFDPGEEVLITEKLHGTNCRLGIIQGEWMAGSFHVRRTRPADDVFAPTLYWYPFSLEPVRQMLLTLAKSHKQVILFGEIIGPKIQSLTYGVPSGSKAFRAFDLLLDGTYVGWTAFVTLCQQFGVETVPVLTRVPYSLKTIREWSEGATTLMSEQAHMREGIVVRPLIERWHPKVGRVILKYLGDTYLFGEKSDYTEI